MQLSVGLLEDKFVRLVPFDLERHAPLLRDMAERSGERLATWPFYNPPGDWITPWTRTIRQRTEAGTLIPFAVLTPDGQFAGMTSYLNPNPEWRNVEVGMTIYAPEFQGRAINPACKRLLLTHAFNAGAIRVYFHVDERNVRSRRAVLKLGAQQEGLLRHNRILPDGFLRSTVVFSILEAEWPAVRETLDTRLAAFE
ncbi:GNAT family N-acetyltransferase [Henriciella litoralis]|uniref:GNAT family N-acetyltransferase n=1 Tax=Henriciella litoralis TaxID=568102 RepID=UPI000A057F90|nr:GNAT family protein [Henriciella litoralis]